MRRSQPRSTTDAGGWFEVLVVDDDALELVLIADAVRIGGFERTRLVRTIAEAMDLLKAPGARMPDLILRDMKLTGESGLQLLSILRRESALQAIPVVMFMSSSAERDVAASYAKRANAYVVKPLFEFRSAIAETVEFWLRRNVSPSQSGVFIGP